LKGPGHRFAGAPPRGNRDRSTKLLIGLCFRRICSLLSCEQFTVHSISGLSRCGDLDDD
jgi:hypothetical protein